MTRVCTSRGHYALVGQSEEPHPTPIPTNGRNGARLSRVTSLQVTVKRRGENAASLRAVVLIPFSLSFIPSRFAAASAITARATLAAEARAVKQANEKSVEGGLRVSIGLFLVGIWPEERKKKATGVK